MKRTMLLRAQRSDASAAEDLHGPSIYLIKDIIRCSGELVLGIPGSAKQYRVSRSNPTGPLYLILKSNKRSKIGLGRRPKTKREDSGP